MKLSKAYLSFLVLLLFATISTAQHNNAKSSDSPFIGEWSFDIDNGNVGWLKLHKDNGYLDGAIMWEGGSATPLGYAYMADEHTLVVSRTYEQNGNNPDGSITKRLPTSALRLTKVGDQLVGEMTGPSWSGDREIVTKAIGSAMPPLPDRPNLANVKYGQPIQLFNGKNLDGWEIIRPESTNGFSAVNGELVNNPVQNKPGEYIHYGNLRTKDVFEDFNLKLEVNVPKGDNSGVYLRGLYEVQVYDSYGKELDSHNMGALYSRITPTVAAEKPAGSWQTLDITLCDRHATVVLNGKKIIDNQPIEGPTGGAIISDVLAPGPIFLQGDHGHVSYRNVVLTPIIN